MIVDWSPPPAPARGARWKQIAEELAERPGEWACVLRGVSKHESDAGRTGLRKYGVQVAQRKVDGVGFCLWARA